MTSLDALQSLLADRLVHEAGPGIFSVLAADTPGQLYDGRARAYDRLIGSRLYNRICWNSSPDDYRNLGRRAVASSESGWLLDAGCGTLLLTADAYAGTDRPIVAVDKSLGMLRRAHQRLLECGGGDNVVFLQADLLDLPFRVASFSTVMSMGMLHIFEQPAAVLASLRAQLAPGGMLFTSSLVANGRIGDRYLRLLHRSGEVATPRNAVELRSIVAGTLGAAHQWRMTGNMAYMTWCRE